MKEIIFTDLDGTLLHQGHFPKSVIPFVKRLKSKKIPVVICSSKTRVEIEVYRKMLDIDDPFISENGGAIFIPKNYFDFEIEFDRVIGKYLVIELGTSYQKLRKVLKNIKEAGCNIIGFGDMNKSPLAKQREYDEPFKIYEKDEKRALEIIKESGLKSVKAGEYHHLIGKTDKGRAVKLLIKLFSRKFGKIRTVGIGDSLNDLPMLKVVDMPVLVQKPDGGYEAIELSNLYKTKEKGADGWCKAITPLTR